MAGFSTAVTGIKATTTALDVTGNNISNASTVGFKASRTEFGDIYSSSVVGAGSSNTPGAGATVGDIAQDFSSGTIEFTNSNLDLAINGSGFFQLTDGQGGTTYTRAGAFELDKDGFIVSKNGKHLMGYGLDAQGNQLPLRQLAVTEKESPPHHTENIALALNINAADDAETNSPYYSKDDANSYTYTTTIETFDSLGNANSIKFDIVEQRAVREVYTYTPLETAANPVDATAGAGTAEQINMSGVGIVWDAVAPATVPPTFVPNAATITALKQADPRIDTTSILYTSPAANPGNGTLTYELFASATQAGDVVITQHDATPAAATLDITNLTNEGKVALRDANETLTATINTTIGGAAVATEPFQLNGDGVAVLKQDMTIRLGINGGVTRTIGANSTIEDIAQVVNGDFADELIANDPRIESVVFNTQTAELKITWKPEAGDVDTSAYLMNGNADTGYVAAAATTPYLFNYTGTATNGTATVTTTTNVKGDDSFEGTYRMYAYLNDNTLLDIGKANDPGEGTGHETGPITIKFNSTSGVLEEVNGTTVINGAVPKIDIWGSDPANPNDDILDGDVDSNRAVQLDITNTTQFASASIVKTQTQDGYAKGDLIGVTFEETGEMVASYSNGQRTNIGIVALATFENQDGLQAAGDSEWVATLASGQATLNPPGTGLNGTLRSAALEQSNVDLSEELVKLIEFQRNYQANSKTLETLNTVTQSVLQI